MSTKIYTGFVTEETNFEVLLNGFKKLAKTFTNEYVDEISELIAETYVSRNDVWLAESYGKLEIRMQPSISDVWNEFFKMEKNEHVLVYHPMSVFLIPHNNKVYGYLLTERDRDFDYMLKEMPFLKEYGYWNNTDQPDEISDEEWEERYNTWREVLDEFKPLPQSGFEFELVPRNLVTRSLCTLDELLEDHGPDLETRLKNLARELVAKEDHAIISQMKTGAEWLQWEMSADVKKRQNDLIEKWRPILPQID